MFVKKMILKDKNESVVLTLTVCETTAIKAPVGYLPTAAEINGKIVAISEENGCFYLPFPIEKDASIALLVFKDTAPFFGASQPKNEALSRWHLLEFARSISPKEEDAKKNDPNLSAEKPLEKTQSIEEESPMPDLCSAQGAERKDEPKSSESKPSLARKRIEEGERFPFLEEAIPESEWAKIEEDGECFYLGVVCVEDGEKVLCAVTGSRETPPIENAAFFPSPEDEAVGFFIREI